MKNKESAMRKIFFPAFFLFMTMNLPAPASAAGLDRGIMGVEFLYAIEYAGGRSDKLREPLDIFFDRGKKELYITDAANRAVFVYDNNGMFLQQIKVDGKEGSPRLVAVDGKGRIYTGHVTSPKLSRLDFRGELLDVVNLPGIVDAPGNTVRPMHLASGSGGEIYALKSAGGIVKVDPDGSSHKEVNITGEGAPNMIYGMTVDGEGRYLFTDMRPYSVVIYDPQKKEFKRFGSPGVLYGQLDRPLGIAADDTGHIFVVSLVTNKVSCFDREGNFIEEFGGFGETYGRFYMPSKIVSDGKDRLFVLENTLKRVQVFRVKFLKEKEVLQDSANASTGEEITDKVVSASVSTK
jgi:sugar lactone lactonase YvrE